MPDFPLPPALEPLRVRLAPTLRPVARFALTGDAPASRRGSFSGGVPYWPTGTAWPSDPSGAPLHFLAQIALEDVPRLPSGEGVVPGLPASGLLQVFLADDPSALYGCAVGEGSAAQAVQDRWRLVYHADASAPPAELPSADGPEYWPLDRPEQARRLVFEPLAYEPVNGSNDAFERLLGEDAFDAAEALAKETGGDTEALAELLFTYGRPNMSRHQIGGWPAFVQGDPEEMDGAERRLLLQFDSDIPTRHGFCWGDVGSAQWLAEEADLARWDLSHILYDWACG